MSAATRPPLLLRSLDLAQGAPFLEEAWTCILAESPSARLTVSDQPGGLMSSIPQGAHVGGMPPDTADRAFESLTSWSIPNERTVEDLVSARGQPTTPGPLSAVYRLADKRTTKHLLEKFSVGTPDWTVIDRGFTRGGLLREEYRNSFEWRIVQPLGLPVLLKPIWDCMGHGMTVARTVEEITDALAKINHRDVLVEKFIDGESGSVEIIGEPGHYVFQHPCRTGPTERSLADRFDAIRVSHPRLFGDFWSVGLRHNIESLLGSLGFRGACCVDFVANRHELKVLEINPRVSGISCLSAAASGLNAFEATYRISSAHWSQWAGTLPLPEGAAVQAGGREATEVLAALPVAGDSIRLYRDNEIIVDGEKSRSVIIGGDMHDIELFLEKMGVQLPIEGRVRWGAPRSVFQRGCGGED